jgi:hypothetical protein
MSTERWLMGMIVALATGACVGDATSGSAIDIDGGAAGDASAPGNDASGGMMTTDAQPAGDAATTAVWDEAIWDTARWQ